MIKAPHWAPDAQPTPRGWVKNGELIKSQKISESDLQAYYGGSSKATLIEAPSNKPVEDMSSREKQETANHYADDEAKPGFFGRLLG